MTRRVRGKEKRKGRDKKMMIESKQSAKDQFSKVYKLGHGAGSFKFFETSPVDDARVEESGSTKLASTSVRLLSAPDIIGANIDLYTMATTKSTVVVTRVHFED